MRMVRLMSPGTRKRGFVVPVPHTRSGQKHGPLIAQLRDILQRDFGAQDAWIVRPPGRCRLDVRVGGRQVTILDDPEDAFWGRFYTPLARERMHLGERRIEVEQWR